MGYDFVFDTLGQCIDLQDSVEDKLYVIEEMREWLSAVENELTA